MNIARSLLDSQGENVVGEAHHGSVFGGRRQFGCRWFLFFLVLDFQSSENFVLQFFEVLRLKFRYGLFLLLFFALALLFLPLIGFPLFFLDAHEVGINRVHEFAEVFFRTNLRLDDDTLDVPAHVVECDEVGGIDHRQRDRVVHVGDRNDLVKLTKRLRQETDHARIELPFEEVDVLNTDLPGCVFKTFRKNSRQAQGNLRMLRQKISEISSSQCENHRGLNRSHGGGPGFSSQQRHFANRRAIR